MPQVRSTYKYTGEDVDELSFEIGDIIRVVEYDDEEEQVIYFFSNILHIICALGVSQSTEFILLLCIL